MCPSRKRSGYYNQQDCPLAPGKKEQDSSLNLLMYLLGRDLGIKTSRTVLWLQVRRNRIQPQISSCRSLPGRIQS
jgi:hypothetical protein